MLSNIDNRIWENRMIAKLLVDPKLIQLLKDGWASTEMLYHKDIDKDGNWHMLLSFQVFSEYHV